MPQTHPAAFPSGFPFSGVAPLVLRASWGSLQVEGLLCLAAQLGWDQVVARVGSAGIAAPRVGRRLALQASPAVALPDCPTAPQALLHLLARLSGLSPCGQRAEQKRKRRGELGVTWVAGRAPFCLGALCDVASEQGSCRRLVLRCVTSPGEKGCGRACRQPRGPAW